MHSCTFTMYQDKSGRVVVKQEGSRSDRMKSTILALSIFRGNGYRHYEQIPQDKLPELMAAILENNGNWANFCVSDILAANQNKLLAFRSIYSEVMGKSPETATGNDMLEATLPTKALGIPWSSDVDEIIERFPSTRDILANRGPAW